MDVNRLLLVIQHFFIFPNKTYVSAFIFMFPTISQILKSKFYVLWTQTCRNLKSTKFFDLPSITCF